MAIKSYTQYTAVLSGGYIYFFAKPKDRQPETYFWVKNGDITPVEGTGMEYAFMVKTKYGESIFACDKEETMKQWCEAIESIRTRKKEDQL